MADPVQMVSANMVGSTALLASSVTTSWGQTPAPQHLLVSAVMTDLAVDPGFSMPGWTQIGATIATLTYAMGWWYRISGAGENGSATVTWTGVAGKVAHVLGEYAGTRLVAVHDSPVLASQSGLISTSPSVQAAAPSVGPSLHLAAVGMIAAVSRSAFLGDFTEHIYQASATASISLLGAATSPGSQPTAGCTLGASVGWCAAVTAFEQMPDQYMFPARLSST